MHRSRRTIFASALAALALAMPSAAAPQRVDTLPALRLSSFLGGAGDDAATAVAFDLANNVYVVGRTASGDFPTAGPRPGARSGAGDVFVTKIDGRTNAVVYSILVGGTGDETATGVAVDALGSAYVVGFTDSLDFPTTPGAYDRANGRIPGCAGPDCVDAFAFKVAPDGGSLVYSTFLGGEHQDYAYGVAVTAEGEAVVAGWTASWGYPTERAFGVRKLGGYEGFVTRLSVDGGSLVYSSYIGGNAGDAAKAVALGPTGDAYVVGSTTSTDFPTVTPLQAANAGGTDPAGNLDAFLMRISPQGALLYSTYFGGKGADRANGVAVDRAGFVSVVGQTTSDDLPTANAFQSSRAGDVDGFVVRFVPDGASTTFATYLGGAREDLLDGVAVFPNGDAFVGGYTRSEALPTSNSWQSACGGCGVAGSLTDGLAARFNTAGQPVALTYLGGRSDDRIAGVAVSLRDTVAVAGITYSADYPLVAPFQPTCRCTAGTALSALVAVSSLPTIGDPAPPVVTSVRSLAKPFRLEIMGSGFLPGATVTIGGVATTQVEIVSESLIRVGGGKALKGMLPKGVPVQIVVTNAGGQSGASSFTR